MTNDFKDIVDILQDRRSHKAQTITLQEICAGVLPQPLTPISEVEKETAIRQAIDGFFAASETE